MVKVVVCIRDVNDMRLFCEYLEMLKIRRSDKKPECNGRFYKIIHNLLAVSLAVRFR